MLSRAFVALIFVFSVAGFVEAQNYKITQTTSMMGQNMTSTVYVKGSRKRTESSGMMGIGGDVADIEQCDLKRNVKVSDKKKMYFVEPMMGGEADVPSTPTPSGPATKPQKGGTITMTSSIVDTGERKQMFGLTARHVKTSMTMVSSPDACSKDNTKIETDGWYVDLPAFSCPIAMPKNPMAMAREPKQGCTDRMIAKQTGTGKLGFPLQLTQKMNSGDDDEPFTQSIDTIEFSKATLADSLFDVPTTYTLAKSSQDLYGRPDFSKMAGMSMGDDDDKPKSNSGKPTMPAMPVSSAPKPGVKRIGVLAPNNPTGENVSTTNLQAYLVQQLTSGSVEAVGVGSEADAKAAGCQYLLSSDFTKLKQSTASKIGGMFGKITNTDTSAARTWDIQIDYLLINITDGKSATKSKAVAKASGEVDRVAETALAAEASAVLMIVK